MENAEQLGQGTEQVQENKPEVTEIEKRAMEMGWRPLAEFHGNENDFVDAKEFVQRQPLFDRIDQQSRQIKAVTKALETWKNHYTTVKEVEYQRALKALQEGRKAALRDGDSDAFETYDTEIKRVEGEANDIRQAKEMPIVQEEQIHPQFQSWLNRNAWYKEPGYMKVFADEVGQKLAAQGIEPAKVLDEVEKAVRKEFPQKFTNPRKESAPDVDSSRSVNKSRKDDFELSDQERKVMNTLIASDPKTFSKDKYIADLKKIKGIS